MNDLLNLALKAHGGLKRWNEFQSLRAGLSIAGAIWDVKHCPGLLSNSTFELQTRYEQLSITPYLREGLRSVFVPDRQTLETLSGEIVESREQPEAAFVNQSQASPWDKFQAAFFASEALWTYLTSPFLYTYPGFETEEIAPWYENGECWRRLRVTFPDHIITHTRSQVTHFGPDGLMRRHDYTVDILGGATGANYVTNYQDCQGLMVPMTRRIFAYDDEMQKMPEPLLVSIDIHHLTFLS